MSSDARNTSFYQTYLEGLNGSRALDLTHDTIELASQHPQVRELMPGTSGNEEPLISWLMDTDRRLVVAGTEIAARYGDFSVYDLLLNHERLQADQPEEDIYRFVGLEVFGDKRARGYIVEYNGRKPSNLRWYVRQIKFNRTEDGLREVVRKIASIDNLMLNSNMVSHTESWAAEAISAAIINIEDIESPLVKRMIEDLPPRSSLRG